MGNITTLPTGASLKGILTGTFITLAMGAGGASAATVSFTDFASTNGSHLHPEVVIEDTAPGVFSISSTLTAPEFGDLVGFFVDFGTGWSAGSFDNLSFVSDAPSVPVGPDFSYEFSTAGINAKTYGDGVCENNILSGGLPLPPFEGVACYRGTGSAKPTVGVNPILLRILDPDGVLELADFQGVALRYKSASNPSGSDKLYASTPPTPIPLPAAGWLLLGALGLTAVARRKEQAA